MKICPICDKKIISNWCGSCFRIVEPWTINDGIHMNERHYENIDMNCDYHNPKIQYSKQEYMQPGYEQKIYGNVQPRQVKVAAPTRNVSSSRTVSVGGSREKKKLGLGAKIAIGYFIFIILASVLPAVFAFVDAYESSSKEPEYPYLEEAAKEVESYNDYLAKTESVEVEDMSGFYETFAGTEYEALCGIEPVDVEKSFEGEYSYTYYYFDGEDLKKVGLECDMDHIDLYYQDLMGLIDKVYPGYSFDYYVNDDNDYNYVAEEDGDIDSSFETYVTIENKDFMIDVSYDSATEKIHYYMFSADSFTEEFSEEMYKWFEEVTPGLFASYDEWVETFESLVGSDDYLCLEYDEMNVYFVAYGDYVLIDFESIYY